MDVNNDAVNIINWSATHDVTLSHKDYRQPESEAELAAMVADAHKHGKKLRPVGSALSPNGLGLSADGMLSMALLDRVIRVDAEKARVTCQAGIRISELVEELRPHGLTLQNYASIREQQVGGFTQVGAHGTGAGIPPVEEMVVGLRLVTPAEGVVHLTRESDPAVLDLAKCGLGALGVVSEVTLQCVPAYRLVEKTFVVDRNDLLASDGKLHGELLSKFLHVRYMWIPFTDVVVVVGLNRETGAAASKAEATKNDTPMEERVRPMKDLLVRSGAKAKDLDGLSFADLRDLLLKRDPLNKEWVKQVNAAEAAFWSRSEGERRGWSDELLGFECGGQQWVVEMAFPCGKVHTAPGGDAKAVRSDGGDLQTMRELLAAIETGDGVPAPAPIEQRWTSGSSAPMSPATGRPDSLHTWIGIIMYLPPAEEDAAARAAVTRRFAEYAQTFGGIARKRNGTVHWAKLEPPGNAGTIYADAADMRKALRAKYPVDEFNRLRKRFDPKGVLANEWVSAVLC